MEYPRISNVDDAIKMLADKRTFRQIDHYVSKILEEEIKLTKESLDNALQIVQQLSFPELVNSSNFAEYKIDQILETITKRYKDFPAVQELHSLMKQGYSVSEALGMNASILGTLINAVNSEILQAIGNNNFTILKERMQELNMLYEAMKQERAKWESLNDTVKLLLELKLISAMTGQHIEFNDAVLEKIAKVTNKSIDEIKSAVAELHENINTRFTTGIVKYGVSVYAMYNYSTAVLGNEGKYIALSVLFPMLALYLSFLSLKYIYKQALDLVRLARTKNLAQDYIHQQINKLGRGFWFVLSQNIELAVSLLNSMSISVNKHKILLGAFLLAIFDLNNKINTALNKIIIATNAFYSGVFSNHKEYTTYLLQIYRAFEPVLLSIEKIYTSTPFAFIFDEMKEIAGLFYDAIGVFLEKTEWAAYSSTAFLGSILRQAMPVVTKAVTSAKMAITSTSKRSISKRSIRNTKAFAYKKKSKNKGKRVSKKSLNKIVKINKTDKNLQTQYGKLTGVSITSRYIRRVREEGLVTATISTIKEIFMVSILSQLAAFFTATILPGLMIFVTLFAILTITMFLLSSIQDIYYGWIYDYTAPTFTDNTLDAVTLSYIYGKSYIASPYSNDNFVPPKCGWFNTFFSSAVNNFVKTLTGQGVTVKNLISSSKILYSSWLLNASRDDQISDFTYIHSLLQKLKNENKTQCAGDVFEQKEQKLAEYRNDFLSMSASLLTLMHHALGFVSDSSSEKTVQYKLVYNMKGFVKEINDLLYKEFSSEKMTYYRSQHKNNVSLRGEQKNKIMSSLRNTLSFIITGSPSVYSLNSIDKKEIKLVPYKTTVEIGQGRFSHVVTATAYTPVVQSTINITRGGTATVLIPNILHLQLNTESLQNFISNYIYSSGFPEPVLSLSDLKDKISRILMANPTVSIDSLKKFSVSFKPVVKIKWEIPLEDYGFKVIAANSQMKKGHKTIIFKGQQYPYLFTYFDFSVQVDYNNETVVYTGTVSLIDKSKQKTLFTAPVVFLLPATNDFMQVLGAKNVSIFDVIKASYSVYQAQNLIIAPLYKLGEYFSYQGLLSLLKKYNMLDAMFFHPDYVRDSSLPEDVSLIHKKIFDPAELKSAYFRYLNSRLYFGTVSYPMFLLSYPVSLTDEGPFKSDGYQLSYVLTTARYLMQDYQYMQNNKKLIRKKGKLKIWQGEELEGIRLNEPLVSRLKRRLNKDEQKAALLRLIAVIDDLAKAHKEANTGDFLYAYGVPPWLGIAPAPVELLKANVKNIFTSMPSLFYYPSNAALFDLKQNSKYKILGTTDIVQLNKIQGIKVHFDGKTYYVKADPQRFRLGDFSSGVALPPVLSIEVYARDIKYVFKQRETVSTIALLTSNSIGEGGWFAPYALPLEYVSLYTTTTTGLYKQLKQFDPAIQENIVDEKTGKVVLTLRSKHNYFLGGVFTIPVHYTKSITFEITQKNSQPVLISSYTTPFYLYKNGTDLALSLNNKNLSGIIKGKNIHKVFFLMKAPLKFRIEDTLIQNSFCGNSFVQMLQQAIRQANINERQKTKLLQTLFSTFAVCKSNNKNNKNMFKGIKHQKIPFDISVQVKDEIHFDDKQNVYARIRYLKDESTATETKATVIDFDGFIYIPQSVIQQDNASWAWHKTLYFDAYYPTMQQFIALAKKGVIPANQYVFDVLRQIIPAQDLYFVTHYSPDNLYLFRNYYYRYFKTTLNFLQSFYLLAADSAVSHFAKSIQRKEDYTFLFYPLWSKALEEMKTDSKLPPAYPVGSTFMSAKFTKRFFELWKKDISIYDTDVYITERNWKTAITSGQLSSEKNKKGYRYWTFMTPYTAKRQALIGKKYQVYSLLPYIYGIALLQAHPYSLSDELLKHIYKVNFVDLDPVHKTLDQASLIANSYAVSMRPLAKNKIAPLEQKFYVLPPSVTDLHHVRDFSQFIEKTATLATFVPYLRFNTAIFKPNSSFVILVAAQENNPYCPEGFKQALPDFVSIYPPVVLKKYIDISDYQVEVREIENQTVYLYYRKERFCILEPVSYKISTGDIVYRIISPATLKNGYSPLFTQGNDEVMSQMLFYAYLNYLREHYAQYDIGKAAKFVLLYQNRLQVVNDYLKQLENKYFDLLSSEEAGQWSEADNYLFSYGLSYRTLYEYLVEVLYRHFIAMLDSIRMQCTKQNLSHPYLTFYLLNTNALNQKTLSCFLKEVDIEFKDIEYKPVDIYNKRIKHVLSLLKQYNQLFDKGGLPLTAGTHMPPVERLNIEVFKNMHIQPQVVPDIFFSTADISKSRPFLYYDEEVVRAPQK